MTLSDCNAATLQPVTATRLRSHSNTSLRVVILLLTASVLLNVALAHRLSQFNSLRIQGRRQLQPALHAGDFVPAFTARATDGKPNTIVYSDTKQPTVLYVFSPECIWCARNLSNIKALIAAKVGEDRFIGMSLSRDGLDRYLAVNQLTIPVYTSLSGETVKSYRLGATPQTIVVSPSGRVLKDWPGAWNDQLRSEIEAYFHVRLPGLDNAVLPPGSAEGQH